MISPDGTQIAYQSNESGRFEIYVSPFPAGGGKHRVSVDGGIDPIWSLDGRELFYRNDNRMMAATVTATPEVQVGAPKVLFTGSFQGDGDISPDGRRFLFLKGADQELAPRTITLVFNWFDEVAQKVGPH